MHNDLIRQEAIDERLSGHAQETDWRLLPQFVTPLLLRCPRKGWSILEERLASTGRQRDWAKRDRIECCVLLVFSLLWVSFAVKLEINRDCHVGHLTKEAWHKISGKCSDGATSPVCRWQMTQSGIDQITCPCEWEEAKQRSIMKKMKPF